jgi:hypothetical protein
MLERTLGTGRGARAAVLVALACAAVGCGRAKPPERPPYALPVDVYADTGRAEPLRVVPPAGDPTRAAVWLARVSPVRIVSPHPGGLEAPAPDAAPETLAMEIPPPPPLAVDEDLKPPIPKASARLEVPPRSPRGVVELDVRVDEGGHVSDAIWAAGSEDSSLVRAATDCALGMSFYPALRAGRPVAVWCRQRFDFGGR